MKGKAYANRKIEKERPESDFYETPKSLTWELMKLNLFDYNKKIGDLCCGKGAISNVLKEKFERLVCSDINIYKKDNGITSYGLDFLTEYENKSFDFLVMNPPFSMFDEFVLKAKEITREKFAFIGKTNFFGAYNRAKRGIWKNLSHVYIFNRQVDYRSPVRDDGLFHVGNLVTGWFLWDMKWNENYWKTSIIDVQKYAKLGQFKG